MEDPGGRGAANPFDSPDEDDFSVSKPTNGKTPSSTAVKESPGLLATFRQSIKRSGRKSPFSHYSQRSKVELSDAGPPENDTGKTNKQISSPSLSGGSPWTTPLKKTEDVGAESPGSRKPVSLSRTFSEPGALDSPFRKGSTFFRSLRLTSKKDKEKDKEKEREKEARGEPLQVLSEVTGEERKEVEDEWEEISESYKLPDVPQSPLSVMQINKLIEMEVLEEAHLNLLSLRQEFQEEWEQCGEEAGSVELAKKEKDLSLLYSQLRDKVKAIVRDSNSLLSRNKGLLVYVARIVQEEERRAGQPGGLAGPMGWMEVWREAVSEGVQAKLASVHLDEGEQDSWLAVHLGLLGKAILEDLETVKRDLHWSYPTSFNVFSNYVECYHQAVGQHLKRLKQRVTKLKDYYALLDWILNRYQSEKIMGSPSLHPQMESESPGPALEEDFLDQLKAGCCSQVEEYMRFSLRNILKMENEGVWKERIPPEEEEGFLTSHIDIDIATIVKGIVEQAGKIDAPLQQKVICSCFEELKHFPKRFEEAFRCNCLSGELPPAMWANYHITYINSLSKLKQQMEEYQANCPANCFNGEVDSLLGRLATGLEDQYKNSVKPYLRRMMTRKWLTDDKDFQLLYSRTKMLAEHCSLMRPPNVQETVDRLHHHTVKEYISQLMKRSYSCKNRKHKQAARKLKDQWAKLRGLFLNMNSSQEWLHPLGDYLSDIIGQEDRRAIKNHLQPLVQQYPDLGQKHLAAVLYFRGLARGREHRLILQRLAELRGDAVGSAVVQRKVGTALFADMLVTANTSLPFSCMDFLFPES